MKKLILVLMVVALLSGCGSVASYHCIDGVEFVAVRRHLRIHLVPHFKPDGSLYQCNRSTDNGIR